MIFFKHYKVFHVKQNLKLWLTCLMNRNCYAELSDLCCSRKIKLESKRETFGRNWCMHAMEKMIRKLLAIKLYWSILWFSSWYWFRLQSVLKRRCKWRLPSVSISTCLLLKSSKCNALKIQVAKTSEW